MKSQTRTALLASLILPAAFITGGCALMDGAAADASAPRAERSREHLTGSNIPRREYDTNVRSISTEAFENAQRGTTPALMDKPGR